MLMTQYPNLKNVFILVFGAFLLYSYYRLGTQTPYVNELWGSIKGNLKNVYTLSIFLCAIPFLTTLYYVNTSKSIDMHMKNNILCGLLCIVIFSIFWMPLSILYLLKKEDKFMIQQLVLITLFLVACSALYVVMHLHQIKSNDLLYKTSYYGMCYFFFHVFALDFISWSYNFF
jgi:hypothetical protein